MRITKKDYQKFLNELGIPEHDLQSMGGRIPDCAKYGNWLRKYDPIAFEVGYNEYITNIKYKIKK